MNRKLFAIGFPKTGTTTLESCLEILGYKVCRGNGMNSHTNYLIALCIHKDYTELARMISYFDAFCDLPWGGSELYRWLAPEYEGAQFILTVRDPEAWYNSVERMLFQRDNNAETTFANNHRLGAYGAIYFAESQWGLTRLAANKHKLIDIYQRYNESVIEYFQGQERFLCFDLTATPQWQTLCDFLGKPIPERPFPHENRGT